MAVFVGPGGSSPVKEFFEAGDVSHAFGQSFVDAGSKMYGVLWCIVQFRASKTVQLMHLSHCEGGFMPSCREEESR